MSSDAEKTIRKYLPQVIHLSLATCANNRPWVSELHFAYDDDLNLYFRSKPSRRHSQEIEANPNVAGNIIEQHGLEDKVRGVYFEGRAEMLENVEETDQAYQQIAKRFGKDPEMLDEAKNNDGHKFYKITVTDYYVFDARGKGPSKKLHLKWKE